MYKKVKKDLFEFLQIIIIAIIIAFSINTFFIANSRVPTSSMEPTIMAGDRVIGLRLSYMFSSPQRGDIIIFKYPDDESVKYVKRIIGLPGDEVKISDGKVYINGNLLDEKYIKEPMLPADEKVYNVPQESYFMLGDNRNYSSDSREWDNSFVASDKVIAKVVIKYFPCIRKIE